MTNQPSSGQKILVAILLSLIILIGGGLRTYNPLWDLGTFPHPDERSTLFFYASRIRWPENGADLLDPRRSTLNPFWDVNAQDRRSYTYGHFPLYTLVATSAALKELAPLLEGINAPTEVITFLHEADTGRGYAVVGRLLVALLDTLSIYLVFLIARRLYGPWAGVLAAAFSAFAVLHIQLAHFFAVDPVSTTFVLLTIYGSLLIFDHRRSGAAILTGIAIGLAVASKFSALPVVLAPAVTGWLIMQDRRSPLGGLGAATRLIGIAAVASFITFALTSPFVLLDWEYFQWAVLDQQGDMVSGVADWPFTRQYRNTVAYIYFIEQQVKWGLGWPLGILAFVGFGWALLRAIGGHLRPGEAIVLAWLVPYFGLNGLFLAKFMRYMSPVTPLVIILGVGLLVAFARRAPKLRPVLVAVSLVILGGTALWATMFVNGVYASEHSWITASRWIYQNVPDGACIAREHWEESVPRDWAWQEPGMAPYLHSYQQPELPMYEPDTQAKFEIIRDTLRHCDYLVIASNRMLRTLPNLSERYPMSTAYYEALFAGSLGYQQVHTVETAPRLGDFVIDDQSADESFTVYDHPKAFIFHKTRELSDAEWFTVLGNTWQEALHGYIGEPTLLMRLRGASNPPQQLNLEVDVHDATWVSQPVDEWPVVSDWNWNRAANESPYLAALVWWLASQVIGLAAFPITLLLFKRLADKGYFFSKSLGWLLVSYGAWLLAGFGLPANQVRVILAVTVLLALISLMLAWRHGPLIRAWWRRQWGYILLGELIFAGLFALFTAYRMANPDLWQPWNGGEKMLEIGFLNAIVRSATMPPYDPFFAGTFINYYYYGLYIVGVLVKLTGIQPTIAFNLAIATLAALTGLNVFGLAAALARRDEDASWTKGLSAGLLALLFVLFFSNLDGMGQFMRNLAQISGSQFTSAIPGLETLVRAGVGLTKAWGGQPLPEFSYWATSRVIPTTINEFPYWSFLFADLHPHMIGIPITALFLALVYNWLKSDTPPSGSSPFVDKAVVGPGTFAVELAPVGDERGYYGPSVGETTFWRDLSQSVTQEWADLRQRVSLGTVWGWLALPFVLGAIAIINAWDMPTYAGLMCAAFALSRYRAGLRPLTLPRLLILAVEFGGFAVLLVGVTFLLYQPFFGSYVPLISGLGLVHDKTSPDGFFKLWGFFLLISFTWLWVHLKQPQTDFAPLRALSLFIRRWAVFPHLMEVYGRVVTRREQGYTRILLAVGFVLALSVALLALDYLVVALLLPWLLISLLLLLRWETDPEQSFVELLVFTGLLVLLGIQFVFLKDWLAGGDHYRMNTFFKFFIQVWVMLGVSAGVMLPILWQQAERWSLGWRLGWQLVVVCFIFSSLVFVVLGTPRRLDDRFPEARPEIGSLDGMIYMTEGTYAFEHPGGSGNFQPIEMRYDYEAIRWLQENVPGTPIIAEAKRGYYREAGMRVAAYTGLPTILGDLHQNEQHPPSQIGARDDLVRQFWAETDPNRFMSLAQELDVSYIYFGQLEQVLYGDQPRHMFDQLAGQGRLILVYENERTWIYQVVRGQE